MTTSQTEQTPHLAYENPYVGPQSYLRDDTRPFEGRERETSDLAALLIGHRLILFYAESGSGKTSLINAGLTPLLEKERNFEVLPITRVSGAVPAGITPANPYVASLMIDIDQSDQPPEWYVNMRLTDFLLDTVLVDGKYICLGHETAMAELDFVESEESEDETDIRPRALIIDQFEEVFTTHQGANATEMRYDFFRQLAEAMADDPYLFVMLSMRADYVHHLNRYVGLLPDGLRTRYYMSRMRPDAALKAVKRPARKAGRPFVAGVAEELVANLRRERGQGAEEEEWVMGETVEPMQLQVVCYQLWQSLSGSGGKTITQADLTSVAHSVLGEQEELENPLAAFVDSALGSYYEQSLAQALQDTGHQTTEEFLREWFSHKLITDADTRGFVLRGDEETAGVPEAVIQALEKRHLIRSETRAGSKWVELVHDTFIEPVQASNEVWTQRQMLEKPWVAAAYRWENRGRPVSLIIQDDLLTVALEEAGDLDRQPRVVREFLQESLNEQTRRQQEEERQRADSAEATNRQLRRQRLGLVAFGIAAAIASLAALFFLLDSIDKNEQLDLSNAELVTTNDELSDKQEENQQLIDDLDEANGELVENQDTLRRTINQLNFRELELSQTVSELDTTRDELQANSLAREAQQFLGEGNYKGAILLALAADEWQEGIAADVLLSALDGLYFSEEISGTFRVEASSPVSTTEIFVGTQAGTVAAQEGDVLHLWAPGEFLPYTATLPISGTLLAMNGEGDRLATSMDGEMVYVWSAPFSSAQPVKVDLNPDMAIDDAIFTPDGERVAIIQCADPLVEERDVSSRTLVYGQTVTGITGETPNWEFEGQAGDEIVITMNKLDDGLDPYLTLWDENNVEIDWNDDGGPGLNSRIEYEIQVPGHYSIEARDLSNSGQFAYELTLMGPPEKVACRIILADDEGGAEEVMVDGVVGGVEDLAFLNARTAILVDENGGIATLDIGVNNGSEGEALLVQILNTVPEDQLTTELLVWPDGRRLVTGGCHTQNRECDEEFDDGFVQWWSIEGTEISRQGTALEVVEPVIALAPELDDTQLVALTSNQEMVRWEMAESQWPALACAATGRNLTLAEWEQTLLSESPGYEEEAGYTYSMICDQGEMAFGYGLHLSFAMQYVESCTLQDAAAWIIEEAVSQPKFTNLALQTTITQVMVAPRSECRDQISSLIGENAPPMADIIDLLQIINSWESIPPDESVVDGVYAALESWPEQARRVLLPDILTEYQRLCPLGAASIDLESNACIQMRAVLAASAALDENAALQAGDTDAGQTLWFLSGEAGDFVTISLNGDNYNFDAYLSLLDEEGVELDWADYGGDGNDAQLAYILPESGNYFVRVGSYWEQGPYEISLTRFRPISLAYDQTESGHTNDAVLWSINGDEGDYVSIFLNGLSQGIDPYLTLLDKTGNEIEWDDDDGVGENARLDYFFQQEATYYILPTSDELPGRYEIRVIQQEPLELAEGDTGTGTTESQSFWQFTGQEEEVIAIEVMGNDEGFAPEITLLDADGFSVAQLETTGEATSTRLETVLTESGTYYIEVAGAEDPGGYEIALNSLQPPVLALDETNEAGTDQHSLWQFTGDASEPVMIEMVPLDEEVEPLLIVIDGQGREIGYADSYDNEAFIARLDMILPYSGTYYVQAMSGRQPGRYEITRSALPVNELSDDQPTEGHTDEDIMWQFTGVAGDVVVITMEAIDDFEPFISLMDSRGDQIDWDSSVSIGENARLETLLPADGTYFLRTGAYGESGQFALNLTRQDPLSLNVNQPVAGHTGEESFWVFSGTSGQAVSIEMMSLDGVIDPFLVLLDDSGMELVTDDNGGSGFDAQLDLILPYTGRYYLHTDSIWNSGEYELSLRFITTVSIVPGEEVTSTTAEQALWVFNGQAGDIVTIEMAGANEFFDPALSLYDPQGVPIAQNNYSGQGYLGNDARIPFALLSEGGQYVIRAGGGLSAEPYTLTLKTMDQIVQEYVATLEADPEFSFEFADEAYELCRYGTLAGFAEAVLPACDNAVALEPEVALYHDGRGLARAATGDFVGAISDFEIVVNEDSYSSLRESRQEWLEALRDDRSPFDVYPFDLETLLWLINQ